ncbi:P-loop containing nucleoside triphosphate hydrolase protein [Spinellus fusiger]|nr:P-loop containing nucleoside triphosphate hydrolase protein [Spinellus fusiger]
MSLLEDLQEYKGNIGVFCRVHPVMDKKKKKETETWSSVVKTMIQSKSLRNQSVFPHKNIQKECYEEGSHLVQPAPEGHTICIFAYGHTGSEKTYTIEGSTR